MMKKKRKWVHGGGESKLVTYVIGWSHDVMFRMKRLTTTRIRNTYLLKRNNSPLP